MAEPSRKTYGPGEFRVGVILVLLAAACGAVLVAVALHPDLDLEAARRFYAGPHHFVGDTPAGIVVRYVAWTSPFVVYAGFLLARLFARGRRWAPTGRTLVFLTLSLAIGPGLLVHATLKEVSHRPRPTSVRAFGGPDVFRPFTRFDGACRNNCSFPSGETAAATWMLAPASLAPPPWRGPALLAAIAFAIGTGLLRMAFGGHFLSDVCGGALITILVVLACRTLVLDRGGRPDRSE